jgi:hypothetical protein
MPLRPSLRSGITAGNALHSTGLRIQSPLPCVFAVYLITSPRMATIKVEKVRGVRREAGSVRKKGRAFCGRGSE